MKKAPYTLALLMTLLCGVFSVEARNGPPPPGIPPPPGLPIDQGVWALFFIGIATAYYVFKHNSNRKTSM
ncbi:MAG: hypothetical protein NTX74_01215 [Flavobacterium sp.]|nr:hypothetical protein [Flavobacterium sp.]